MSTTKDERGLLRQQMELLARHSLACETDQLPALTSAMIEIYKTLYWQTKEAFNPRHRSY